jgi:hypothetical protein
MEPRVVPISSLPQLAKVGDAAVRVVALVVVALAIVIPLVIVLLVAVFKKDAQDYAYALLNGTAELFKTILGIDRR